MSSAAAILDKYIREVSGERRLEVNTSGSVKTVELREVYDYEEQLINDLIEPSTDMSVTGGAVPVKGRWIEGWLSVNGEDYINHIHKNYQFFLRYLQARTEQIANMSTFKRTAGDYDATYRYILLLEDLGLVDRFRREEVPASEFDIPVPEEFRTRTFVRKEVDYQDAPDAWNNPYAADYPDIYDDAASQTDDITELDIEPEEPPKPTGVQTEPDQPTEDESTVDDIIGDPDGETIEVEPEIDEDETSGADQFLNPSEQPDEPMDEQELGGDGASIEDFQAKDFLVDVISDNFGQALDEALKDPPIPTDIDSSDIEINRIAVFGPWAEGEAIIQQSPLSVLISINSSGTNVGFLTATTKERLEQIMNDTNLFDSTFPEYEFVVVYNNAFNKRIEDLVKRTQSDDIYYDLKEESFKSL